MLYTVSGSIFLHLCSVADYFWGIKSTGVLFLHANLAPIPNIDASKIIEKQPKAHFSFLDAWTDLKACNKISEACCEIVYPKTTQSNHI